MSAIIIIVGIQTYTPQNATQPVASAVVLDPAEPPSNGFGSRVLRISRDFTQSFIQLWDAKGIGKYEVAVSHAGQKGEFVTIVDGRYHSAFKLDEISKQKRLFDPAQVTPTGSTGKS